MKYCLLCDGWLEEEEPMSREVRGLLSPRGKMVVMEETGRAAHYRCVKAAQNGITWKEERLFDE